VIFEFLLLSIVILLLFEMSRQLKESVLAFIEVALQLDQKERLGNASQEPPAVPSLVFKKCSILRELCNSFLRAVTVTKKAVDTKAAMFYQQYQGIVFPSLAASDDQKVFNSNVFGDDAVGDGEIKASADQKAAITSRLLSAYGPASATYHKMSGQSLGQSQEGMADSLLEQESPSDQINDEHSSNHSPDNHGILSSSAASDTSSATSPQHSHPPSTLATEVVCRGRPEGDQKYAGRKEHSTCPPPKPARMHTKQSTFSMDSGSNPFSPDSADMQFESTTADAESLPYSINTQDSRRHQQMLQASFDTLEEEGNTLGDELGSQGRNIMSSRSPSFFSRQESSDSEEQCVPHHQATSDDDSVSCEDAVSHVAAVEEPQQADQCTNSGAGSMSEWKGEDLQELGACAQVPSQSSTHRPRKRAYPEDPAWSHCPATSHSRRKKLSKNAMDAFNRLKQEQVTKTAVDPISEVRFCCPRPKPVDNVIACFSDILKTFPLYVVLNTLLSLQLCKCARMASLSKKIMK
jgi:hypothetical protein